MSASLKIAELDSGQTFNFGTVDRNVPLNQQFTLQSVGVEPLNIGGLLITGDGFAIDDGDNPSNSTLEPEATATVTVTGLFASSGTKHGQLLIPSDDPASPYLIGLAATVPAPRLAQGSGRFVRWCRSTRSRRRRAGDPRP